MRYFGTLIHGPNSYELAADNKYAMRYVVTQDGRVASFSVWMDGLGSGGGDQPMHPVIYDIGGALIAAGDEFVVPAGSPAQRFSASFVDAHPGGVDIVAGEVLLGLHAGSPQGARVYGDPGSALGGVTNADIYADGPADPFGATSELGHDLSLFAATMPIWTPPADETEEWYARMPFGQAEDLMLAEGTKPGAITTDATWHGTHFDPEIGAFAVVRDDGPLTDLIGQRVLVRVGTAIASKRVAVFVHTMGPVRNADISLTRRAFAEISGLAVGDSIPVTLEVLG